MIHSMTGFGRGHISSSGISVTVEVKSVNNRYSDISFHMPAEVREKELTLKECIQEHLSRGKLDVYIRVDQSDIGEPEIAVNRPLAKGYKNLLDELRQVTQLKDPVSLGNLLQFDEIFTSREQDEEIVRVIQDITLKALQEALHELIKMRAQEGEQLQEDLLRRVDFIDDQMWQIKQLTKGRGQKARDELQERIDQLVSNDKVDDQRLEMEVAILVDKMDITEEIVRLQSHIKFFKEALKKEAAVGRRLKFLAQEMNREINTIGSKANNADISQHVVNAKESLEQIKEQIANVE